MVYRDILVKTNYLRWLCRRSSYLYQCWTSDLCIDNNIITFSSDDTKARGIYALMMYDHQQVAA